MIERLDQDIRESKDRLQAAWRRLADPSLTPFDRRELRNYMKEAELALSAGLKCIGDRELARREAAKTTTKPRLDFRIIQLTA
jgi:hypothetical protein